MGTAVWAQIDFMFLFIFSLRNLKNEGKMDTSMITMILLSFKIRNQITDDPLGMDPDLPSAPGPQTLLGPPDKAAGGFWESNVHFLSDEMVKNQRRIKATSSAEPNQRG